MIYGSSGNSNGNGSGTGTGGGTGTGAVGGTGTGTVTTKTIKYKVTIKNENSSDIKGTFTDTPDSGITISKMSDGTNTITSGQSITITGKSSIEIEIEATFGTDLSAGIYKNTATFESGSKFKIKSTDYFKIKKDPVESESELKKYITEISVGDSSDNNSGWFVGSRSGMDKTQKESSPGEAEKGSIVTYSIELTAHLEREENTSEKKDIDCTNTEVGDECSEHKDKSDIIDWVSCTDTFDPSELQFVSVEKGDGETYDVESVTSSNGSVEIKWKEVKANEKGNDSDKTTLKAKIKFKVLTSDMRLKNIENKVSSPKYHYTVYNCAIKHGDYEEQTVEVETSDPGIAGGGSGGGITPGFPEYPFPEYPVPGGGGSGSGSGGGSNPGNFEDPFYQYYSGTSGALEFDEPYSDTVSQPYTFLEFSDPYGNYMNWQYGGGGGPLTPDPWPTDPWPTDPWPTDPWPTDPWPTDPNLPGDPGIPPIGDGSSTSGGPTMVETSVCKHDNCEWEHTPTEKDVKLADAEDYDYVRILDPVIEGIIFLDEDDNDVISGSESLANMDADLYKPIIVELICLNGNNNTNNNNNNENVVGRTTTTDGKYSFGRVRKGNERTGDDASSLENTYSECGVGKKFNYNSATLLNYQVKFSYDGERFEPVANHKDSHLDATTHAINGDFKEDSNAEEDAQKRLDFNKDLETITGSGAYGVGNINYKTYDKGDFQVSEAIWSNSSGIQSSILTMTAKSFELYYDDGEVEYLKYINLGLRRREEANLSLKKDVVQAKVTINGYETTYKYSGASSKGNIQEEPYKLRIYKEDYEFRTTNYDTSVQSIVNGNNPYDYSGTSNSSNANDLQIVITYSITVTNNSPTSVAKVREIIDYSSKELELMKVRLEDNTPVTFSSSSTYNRGISSSYYNINYFSGFDNKSLSQGESFTLYVDYIVLKDSNKYVYVDGENDGIFNTKVNIAEIGAYSFYQSDGTTPAGLVDINSKPANASNTTDGQKVEDDTFVTGIGVTLRDDTSTPTPPPPSTPDSPDDPVEDEKIYRYIKGYVFEEIDKNITEKSDGEKVGDGIQNGNDKPAKDVIVKLYEVVRSSDGTEYLVDTGVWDRTGSDGNYKFGGKEVVSDSAAEGRYAIHAGKYIVRFVYGDEADKLTTDDGTVIKYSGQDYKSTQYTEPGKVGEEAEIVEATAFNEKSNGKERSFAKDNEIRRLEVNEYSTTMTYPMDTILKAQEKSEEMTLLSAHTSMFADTKAFHIRIEYYTNYSDKNNWILGDVSGYSDRNDYLTKYKYVIEHIDFGLIERPQTKLQLMNDISEIKAITSDGETLLDLFFDIIYTQKEDGSIEHTTEKNETKSKGFEQVQVLNRNGSNQGFRYVNIDNDLLQGMTIMVKYQIAIANISEVDHLASWLEIEIENNPNVDLTVTYDSNSNNSTITSTAVAKFDNNQEVMDIINGEERVYDYSDSYLYKLLYTSGVDIKLEPTPTSKPLTLSGDDKISEYKYTSNNDFFIDYYKGSDNVKKAYTYLNIKHDFDSTYKPGDYLGNIYYYNVKSGNEAQVKTRVNQYIDYVDNDLIFKPEENINDSNQITYLTYSTEEIAKRGLLKDITTSITQITDGEKYYYKKDDPNVNNNLAFNIEDSNLNPTFYKFMEKVDEFPLVIGTSERRVTSQNDNDRSYYFYCITLQASRTLTSEADIEGLIIDNLAEIVKVSNTAGRKVYVKASEATSADGFIGNTTKTPIESVNNPNANPRKTLVSIARAETDTDFTEFVTLSPPTGLNEQQSKENKIINSLLIIVPVIIIIGGMSYVTVQFIKRKKFYK